MADKTNAEHWKEIAEGGYRLASELRDKIAELEVKLERRDQMIKKMRRNLGEHQTKALDDRVAARETEKGLRKTVAKLKDSYDAYNDHLRLCDRSRGVAR